MTKADIIRKLTSRKLWMAIALFVSGLIVALGGEKATAETVSGCIMQGAAVLGYLLAEGLADYSHGGTVEQLPVLEGIAVEDMTDDQLRALFKQLGYDDTENMARDTMLAALDEM